MISFEIHSSNGDTKRIEVPEGINISLMEVLKASDYKVSATCGGIALCATCHVEVLKTVQQLGTPGNAEMDMLDTLPNAVGTSRLSCQIHVGSHLNGAAFRLMDESG